MASSSAPTPRTRGKTSVWLVGGTSETIKCNKLPSLRETLSLFFHYHNEEKLDLKESGRKTVREVFRVWEIASIPTSHEHDVLKRLLKVHTDWQGLKKNAKRTGKTQIINEKNFDKRLDSLFDISHERVTEIIKCPEDLAFLEAQRAGIGRIGGEDRQYTKKQEKASRKRITNEMRREKSRVDVAKINAKVQFESSSSSSEENSTVDRSNSDDGEPPPKKARGKKSVITREMAAAMDRIKITDRQAPHLLGATAQALGHDVDELSISRSTIRRYRMKFREERAKIIKDVFSPNTPLVIHWDGKLLPDITGSEKVDRLPVLVSGGGCNQLLRVPKLTSGTGQAMSVAVVNAIDEWNMRSKVKGMCFDTTASNTGRIAGACTLIQRELGHDLLHLACRHHMYEILAQKVFEELKISSQSRGPEISIFQRFQKKWSFIDRKKFESAVDDEGMVLEIEPFRDSVIEFAKRTLEERQPRDDYKELLELTIIFLGEVPSRGIHFIAREHFIEPVGWLDAFTASKCGSSGRSSAWPSRSFVDFRILSYSSPKFMSRCGFKLLVQFRHQPMTLLYFNSSYPTDKKLYQKPALPLFDGICGT